MRFIKIIRYNDLFELLLKYDLFVQVYTVLEF